eukprot:8351598-Alexandrium_andersonii.AAC.1
MHARPRMVNTSQTSRWPLLLGPVCQNGKTMPSFWYAESPMSCLSLQSYRVRNMKSKCPGTSAEAATAFAADCA